MSSVYISCINDTRAACVAGSSNKYLVYIDISVRPVLDFKEYLQRNSSRIFWTTGIYLSRVCAKTKITHQQGSLGFWTHGNYHHAKFKSNFNNLQLDSRLSDQSLASADPHSYPLNSELEGLPVTELPQMSQTSPLYSNIEDKNSQMFLFADDNNGGQLFEEYFTYDKEGYTCVLCPYKTNVVSNLKSHLRCTHSLVMDNNVTCQKCGRIFKHKSSLQRHERETHLENVPAVQMFVCQECPYRTFRVSNLKRHYSKHSKSID